MCWLANMIILLIFQIHCFIHKLPIKTSRKRTGKLQIFVCFWSSGFFYELFFSTHAPLNLTVTLQLDGEKVTAWRQTCNLISLFCCLHSPPVISLQSYKTGKQQQIHALDKKPSNILNDGYTLTQDLYYLILYFHNLCMCEQYLKVTQTLSFKTQRWRETSLGSCLNIKRPCEMLHAHPTKGCRVSPADWGTWRNEWFGFHPFWLWQSYLHQQGANIPLFPLHLSLKPYFNSND